MTKAKILCIEDDLDMIEYIKLILGKAGYDVVGAEGGVEGLEAMAREKPDLILLDLMMPGMDGADVLLHKKEDATIRDIPVIALTALDSPFDQVMWLARTDLQDFIVKSKLPRRELIARIERALHTQSGPPPSEASPNEAQSDEGPTGETR
jgi:CheY-like chemotaxis protein